jgi:superfamily II DNA or RNA helicase
MIMFSSLSFRYPFRKYQRMILAEMEVGQEDRRYHIVAPPGSGKTIVGLELIRRFDAPAIVFAPTTTIQMQWRERVAMFTDHPEQVESLTSIDPKKLAPINIFTYQLISTVGESQEYVQRMAELRWITELVEEGQVADEAAAQARLKSLEENNPLAYRRERSRRYLRIKRELLRHQDVDIAQFLHPNAQYLIQDLIDYGVRTVVLDECHHLLDYWAIVLSHLIRQIEMPSVVGLTATLPNPENEQAYENYTSLLGDVDFEVPTPAVVKEGDLAPYRDLVYFVQPSPRELDYLNNIQSAFEAAIADLTNSPEFQAWVMSTLLDRLDEDGTPIAWEDFLHAKPLLSLAGLRFLKRINHPLPSDLTIPLEAHESLTLDDWAVLLERYGLDHLKLSADTKDHERFKRLRKILQPFGMTLTERGLRHGRSPGDLVLTFSEAKDKAVAEILSVESRTLGDSLRAVVVTDFERMSSGIRRLKGVLDRDAGSARRVFRHLVSHPEAGELDPILVTGRTLLVDADLGPRLLEHFNTYLRDNDIKATCCYQETKQPQILAVVGQGQGWSPRAYVRMVTDTFERGLTRCLVGTRGIFGEGWDSLKLNTLIDLTSVTTSTSVQQLRGRSIRKDPAWPRKVAHNWDVVCVAPQFKRGDTDLDRFRRRHHRYWGIVPLSWAEQILDDAKAALAAESMLGGGISVSDPEQGEPNLLGEEIRGQIVKGVAHVSPQLAYELALRGLRHTRFSGFTRQMMRQVKRRDRIYDLWRIGEEYSNFSYAATRLDARDLKIRTVYTVQNTLKRMLRSFRASMAAGALTAISYSLRTGIEGMAEGMEGKVLCGLAFLTLLVTTFVTFLANLRSAIRLGRTFLIEQPADAILLDAGRALLFALKETKLVSRNLQPDYVRVTELPDNSYQVLLDYASPEDASVFIKAYQEMFEPVVDQRYLILRDDSRLPNLGLSAFWFMLRRWFHNVAGYKPAYHPVPKVLSVRKDRAQAFAQAWRRFVGGGQLVFTRSGTGRKVLLQARAQRRPNVKGLAFETWR